MAFIFPILESILLPPGVFLLLFLAGLVLLLLRRRAVGATIGFAGAALFYLASIIPVASLLILPLENRYPPYHAANAGGASAVVVLGGGLVPVSPAAGGRPTLAPEALKRLVYGEELASAARLPLIVSGGVVPSRPAEEPEAAVARRALISLGVPAARISIEAKSRNTWENALQVEKQFHPKKVILVTSAYHMPRSVVAFNRNHIQVVPAPTDYLAGRGGFNFYSFLPDAESLRISAIALKEYIGYLYYRLLLAGPRPGG